MKKKRIFQIICVLALLALIYAITYALWNYTAYIPAYLLPKRA
jgi:hypothetical protein